MTSDPLLARLARLDRETHVEHDPRWDALSAGALPPADVDALRAAAAQQRRPDLVDAFSPLDAEARGRLTDHASWLLRATSGAARAMSGSAPTTPRPISQIRRVAKGSDPLRPSRGAFAVALAVAFCAAAAAIVLFVRLRPDPVAIVTPAARPVAAIPAYLLEASGGDAAAAVRSASESPPRAEPGPAGPPSKAVSTLGAGTPFSLLLRPVTPVIDPVDVRACAARGDRIQPWSPSWERSEKGSFRVEGTRESLFPGEPPGELTLVLAVGPPGALPACEALAARLPAIDPAPAPDGIVLLTHRVVLR